MEAGGLGLSAKTIYEKNTNTSFMHNNPGYITMDVTTSSIYGCLYTSTDFPVSINETGV